MPGTTLTSAESAAAGGSLAGACGRGSDSGVSAEGSDRSAAADVTAAELAVGVAKPAGDAAFAGFGSTGLPGFWPLPAPPAVWVTDSGSALAVPSGAPSDGCCCPSLSVAPLVLAPGDASVAPAELAAADLPTAALADS